MKKKKIHASPMEYRICYIINNSVSESVQYYNVYHSSEAIDFLAHTLRSGHVHGGNLLILRVEEFDRFGNKWVERTATAIEYASSPEIFTEEGQTWLRSTTTS